MKKVFHKILSLILAFTVLFSTISFTVEKHICMGEVTDATYFISVESCGMTVEDCEMAIDAQEKVQKEKCCQDIQELIPGNQNEQQAIDSFELDQVQFILAFASTYLDLFEENTDQVTFKYYTPPLVGKDINVLYQTFLI
jgi:hypothetical protein